MDIVASVIVITFSFLLYASISFGCCLILYTTVSGIFPAIKKISWRYQVLVITLIFAASMKIISLASLI